MLKQRKITQKVPKLYLSKLNHNKWYHVVGIQTADKHIIYVVCVCLRVCQLSEYAFNIHFPILCKRSITYQDVCLLDGDRPYDTFIHFPNSKTHWLLYIHSACMHARLQIASITTTSSDRYISINYTYYAFYRYVYLQAANFNVNISGEENLYKGYKV